MPDDNETDVRRLFHHLKQRAGVKRARLVITQKPKVNAMTNMVTHTIHLTTLDFKILSLDEVKALLGHELGHLHDQKQIHYWIFNGILFTLAFLLSFINIDVNNPWLNFLIGVVQILVELGVLLIPISVYERHGEIRADRFGAKLGGTKAQIDLLRTINNYETEEIRQARLMTEKLKTVPTAYLRCEALLLWHQGLAWLNRHNLGIHPSMKSRIALIKKMNNSVNG